MGLKSRNKVSPDFNMSSMADLIFLLLIFFMITSTLVSPNGVKLLLPNSQSKTLAKQNVVVSITPELEYFIGQKKVDIANLGIELQNELNGVEDPTLILRADKDVAIQYVIKVMDVANENKFKVVLATKPN